jgi:hypothetical protein
MDPVNPHVLVIKKHVTSAIEELVRRGYAYDESKYRVWDRVREVLNKSYGDCDESDIPTVKIVIELLLQE